MDLLFDTISKPIPEKAASALSRIGVALKSHAWAGGERHGLTPTQAQIVGLLAEPGLVAPTPSRVATRLQVSRPTVSDALASLARKGFIARLPSGEDGRSTVLALTAEGHRLAAAISDWPEFLVRAIAELPETQQVALYRGLIGTIRSLQRRGEIPVQRMCVTCRYFQPNVHANPAAPHHCALVDAPFGDRHLRLDCPEQETASDTAQNEVWTRFMGPDGSNNQQEKRQ